LRRALFFETCLSFLLDVFVFVFTPAIMAQAPAPVLEELSPPAAEPGKVTRVTLVGKNLEKVTGIRFEDPGLRASLFIPPPAEMPGKKDSASDGKKPPEQKPPEPSTLVWEVAVDEKVPPGLYDLRVVNELGISAPRAIHVSPLPLVTGKDPEKGQPVEISTGCRVHGYVEGGEVERFHWKASRKERVVVECLAERLGSRLDAALQVKDSSGRRVAFSHDRVWQDPVLCFDAAEGSEYTVELWDFTYQGKYPYLLSISISPRVLFVSPPVGPASGLEEALLYGWNLPGSAQAPGTSEPLEVLKVENLFKDATGGATGLGPFLTYRPTRSLSKDLFEMRPPGLNCEPLLVARASSQPISFEREPNDSPREATPVSVPAVLWGRFDRPRDLDWCSFSARKGEKLEIEVLSARLGAPCDPLLLLAQREVKKTREAGKETDVEVESLRDLQLAEERKNSFPRHESFQRKFVAPERDPVLVWTPPSDGEYLIQTRNRNHRSGLDAMYVLLVRKAAADVSAVVIQSENVSGEAATVPRGGAQSYDVLLERRGGFDESVKVSAEALPAGVTCPPVYLAKEEAFVPLVFLAAPDAEGWNGNIEVILTGEAADHALRRTATYAVTIYGGIENRHPLQYVQSRLTRSLPLAVRGPAAFGVRLEAPGKPVPPGAKVSIPVKASRRDGFQEPIQLSFQGFGEEAFPDENGQRPSKLTVEKDKTAAVIQINIKNDASYGPHTFVAYGSAQVEYPEAAPDPKGRKEKKKRRTTFPSNPVTVEVAPPVAVIASELKAVIPAGGRLKVPFEVRRLDGVEGEVEAALQIPDGLKDFSAAPVKLKKGETAGEILLQSELDGEEGKAGGFQIRTRVDFAGKVFEGRSNLPLEVERVSPLHLAAGSASWEICPGGALPVPFRVDLAVGVEGKVSVALKVPKGMKGIDGTQVELPEGAREGQVKVLLREGERGELQGLELEASIERNGKKFAATVPLPRVRVGPAFDLGAVAQARVGALRFELKRHPSLAPGSDLSVRIEATALSSLTAGLTASLTAGPTAKAEARFAKGESSKGILLDTSSILDPQKEGALFPLKVRITIPSEKGETAEEHVVNGDS
jgi:hypothetical protein